MAIRARYRIEISQYASAMGVVKAAEEAVLTHSKLADRIFIVQALPYIVGSNGDPWSPRYPTRDQAIKLAADYVSSQADFDLQIAVQS